jgi:hypothetical protein
MFVVHVIPIGGSTPGPIQTITSGIWLIEFNSLFTEGVKVWILGAVMIVGGVAVAQSAVLTGGLVCIAMLKLLTEYCPIAASEQSDNSKQKVFFIFVGLNF